MEKLSVLAPMVTKLVLTKYPLFLYLSLEIFLLGIYHCPSRPLFLSYFIASTLTFH